MSKDSDQTCGYVQADLRLCWSHKPHCWKSHVGLILSLQREDTQAGSYFHGEVLRDFLWNKLLIGDLMDKDLKRNILSLQREDT